MKKYKNTSQSTHSVQNLFQKIVNQSVYTRNILHLLTYLLCFAALICTNRISSHPFY